MLFVLGFITLLLFDNDQAATPIEHRIHHFLLFDLVTFLLFLSLIT